VKNKHEKIDRSKLEHVQDKLGSAQDAVKYFKLLEMASSKAEDISVSIQRLCLGVQHGEESINDLKHTLSESEKKKNAFVEKPKTSSAFHTNIHIHESSFRSGEVQKMNSKRNVPGAQNERRFSIEYI
jgi:kinesin family member 15